MPKNKNKASIREFIKVYGVNAVLGFGLGVAIVLLCLTLWGGNSWKEDFLEKTQEFPKKAHASQEVNPFSSGAESSESNKEKGMLEENKPSSIYGEPLRNSRFTVLLVGMDNRPGETYLSNTDSLLVASMDQTNHRMMFLSIPRDTQVNLPGSGIQKINAIARVQKGFPATQKYIEGLIGFPIDGYVSTNFNGFKSIIDGLGGITLTVEKNMHYDTGDSQDRYIDLKKGTQRLTGSQALQYARFRNDEMADISRTVRQQAVLKAIFTEATALKNLPKLPFIIPKVYQAVQTNLSIGQLWSLASVLSKAEGYQTVSQTLPGRFATEQGISYWKVNSNLTQKAVSQFFLEGKTASLFTQENRSDASTAAENSSKSLGSSQTISPKSGDLNANRKEKAEVKNPNSEIQFEVIKK